MQIISTNVGQSKTIEWAGKEVSTGIFKFPVNKPILLKSDGVVQDYVADTRVHGGTNKACYLYSSSHYSFWKKKFKKLQWQWGMFGENLTVADLDEKNIFVGDIYAIGESLVQIMEPRQPCYKLGVRFEDQSIIPQFIKAGMPGAYVRVLKEGHVNVGDKINLLERFSGGTSIHDIFKLIYKPNANIEKIKIVIQVMAESCRKSYELRSK